MTDKIIKRYCNIILFIPIILEKIFFFSFENIWINFVWIILSYYVLIKNNTLSYPEVFKIRKISVFIENPMYTKKNI